MWNARNANKPAGSFGPNGYRQMKLDGRTYIEHRVAWFFVHGRWPTEQLDHINGVRHDNRIANLRECNRYQNQQNNALKRTNTSGVLGASFSKVTGKWVAQIWANRKHYYLGNYDTKEEAGAVYLEAKARLHGFQMAPRQSRKVNS